MNTNIQKRALIYCRVSTKEQADEGNSLVTQERICREYAIKHNYEIVDVFIERGESAKTANRPELNRLTKFCANKGNGIKTIIIYKLDRLSRNTDDYSELRILLKRYGVEIKSTSENFENTPVGKFMENTIMNIGQFDNDVRAERCSEGMKQAVREGRYVWMAPIGYDNVRVAGKATIAINEKMGPLMHKAFELVATNAYSIDHVRKILTKEGLTNKRGKSFSKSYFYTALTNAVYAGWIVKFKGRQKGTFEPLVTDELFTQVQRVLKNKGTRQFHRLTDNPDFPLRRFVKNSLGNKLTGSWSKGRKIRYPYYRFGGKSSNYNRDEFERRFKLYMDSFALSDQQYKKLIKFIKKHIVKADESLDKRTEYLKREIADLNERQTALIQKNLDGVIKDEILKTQLENIDIKLMELGAELINYSDNKVNIVEALEYLKEYFERPSKIWANANLKAKIALQWFQFPLGIVYENNSFGTTKIASVFNVKTRILSKKSSRVDSRFRSWNHPKSPTVSTNTATIPLPNKAKTESGETFWKDFRKDVITISMILQEEQGSPTTSLI